MSLIKDLTYKSKSRVEIFLSLEPEEQASAILQLSKHVQAQLLHGLKKETVLSLLERLDPDDATDLLQTLPSKLQKSFIEELSEDLQQSLSLLLQFDSKTAAGLMSLNYILIDSDERLSSVVEQIHTHEKRTGKFPMPLVLKEGKLIGYLPAQHLLFAHPSDRAEQLAKKILAIKDTTHSDSVITHFLENPHKKIAVLGEQGNVLGVLYSDDVLRVLQEREVSSLYDFAGLNAEESVLDSIQLKIKRRYKWLIINLATSFLAAFTVGFFDATISKYVLLAVYMPIVAGMGGNSATQTLAVLVRGITLKQIDLRTAGPTLLKEVGAGFANGVINGVIVFGVVYALNKDWKVAFVLAMAMIVNLVVAGFFGTLVPLVMKQLGKDPATSATIFITTATDILGFIVFLGLATLIMR